MLTAITLHEQIDTQRDDPLRILIVGAGVAGITLAALLRKQGLHPVLIERMAGMEHPGYMLALMPMLDQALEDIGVHDEYLARSAPLARYAFRSHRGRMLRSDDLGALLAIHGDYQGIERGALIEVLTTNGCPVTFDTTVIGFNPGERPEVMFSTGEGASFDLVVAADGIRSRTRDLLDVGDASIVDTGWAGWVTWSDVLGDDPALGEELWGDGFFLGAYPVKDRLGIFVGGPAEELEVGPAAFAARVRDAAPELGDRLQAALDAVATDPDPYLWPLADVRAERWVVPGAVLLGDAASGFLPTAGIGAGMAMESAWMLGRMLAHADRGNLAALLAEWESVQKPRVESAQSNSRMLARLMFRRGKLIARLRETAMRMLSVKAVLGPIIRLIADQPDPDATWRRSSDRAAPAA
ncbi:NAD(P)/FAD-dependent oxidoreductase [Microbacterium sp.]|uniref:FAD-dependent oxidoreductase n=1 Tax=Microbacterium sp. TaxID=51671 RepID=UPI0027339614|nr:NAD(P)/FAD-dependent oxidoreductase [Microbacterium sp.]MDP3949319.1 NAD(P)/FAD-dependent oxidoreductase [Microbacterium sp.]